MKTVTEIIGEEYKNWAPGDIVTIATPTGSGKSTFVIKTLLEWALWNGLPILYLVNRKILKDQLEQRLATEVQALWGSKYPSYPLRSYITVRTYQSIEEYLKNGSSDYLNSLLSNYGIVVYDECHYFLTDASFNPATDLSYNYLTRLFDHKIQIFMSATFGSMKPHIDSYIKNAVDSCTNAIIKSHRLNDKFYYTYPGKDYSVDQIYDYIELHIIGSEEEIPALIEEDGSSRKWLIFVDDMKKGTELQNTVMTIPGYENEVLFINAQYKSDLTSYEKVLELQMNEIISKKVVISTSAMDNGISFKDTDLQNIVIFADMEEPFIQMLGRKRRDEKKVNLYICRRNGAFFSSRIRNIDATLERYYKLSVENNQIILNTLLSNTHDYPYIIKFCYAQNGSICRSKFAINRLSSMRSFYETMVEKIENDNDAFLYEQARWLGISREHAAKMFKDSWSKATEAISGIIKASYLDKDLNSDENRKMTCEIKKDVRILLMRDNVFTEKETKKIYSGVKGDRPFSVENFNTFMSKFTEELPFVMTKPNQETFKIVIRPAQDNSCHKVEV